MIKISVIIPVYNTELYLEQCIDSILAQTVPPYEIILVDDGSTDSSGSICDRYDMQFPIIKCFHQSNGGVSKARNTGLEQASGDFVLFVDSDDYIDNNLLAQLEIKDENPDLVFFQFTSLYENNFYRIRQPIHKLVQEPWNFLLLYQTPKGKMINGVFEDNTIAVYNFRILIRRQLLVKNNIKYNELIRSGEDRLFLYDLLLSADSIDIRDDVYGYYYRQHGTDSLTGSNDKPAYKKWLWPQIIIYDKAEQTACQKNPHLLTDDLYRIRLIRASKLRITLPYNEFAFNRAHAAENMDVFRKEDLFLFAYRWKTFLGTKPFPGIKELLKFIFVKYRFYFLLKLLYRR